MAFPTSFDESNAVLGRPDGVTDEQCGPLSIAYARQPDGIPNVVSCWKLTREELDEINRTGRVWIGVLGEGMPAIWVSGVSPFVPQLDGTNEVPF